MKTRVYLDNCCFNRPFDDSSDFMVWLEAEATIFIQSLIMTGEIELAWSHVLNYENANNPYEDRRNAIAMWRPLSTVYQDVEEETVRRAQHISKHGFRNKDALHIACAIQAKCHYFLTTDKGILKRRLEEIILINPLDFFMRMEADK